MSGHARPWDLKPRQRNLTPVMRRPVELSAMCGRLRVGKGFLHVCRLVGAAMCSACWRGTQAAGHNALRGSGPGQKLAFDNALALVGCPDRRDRPALHYVLFALPTFTSRRWPARSRLYCQCAGFFVALAFRHRRPRHSRDLLGECDRGDLRWPPRQQCCEPGPVLGAMDFGIADHGERTGREKAAQVAITLLADAAELVFAAARVLLRHEPNPGREIPP